jgi:predicted nucleotidyltransferase
MEIVRNVAKWGNGAGVLLPKEWLGNRVKIVLMDRSSDIRKEVLDMLAPYLEDIIGIYLTGSYARGEQEADSDVDIVAISKHTKKEIISGKYHVSIITLEGARSTLEKDPILILPRLYEAKPIMNEALLNELKALKVSVKSFKGFLDESARIIKICEEFIRLDREQGFTKLDSENILYPLILRLRGLFLMHTLLRKEKYSKDGFLKSLDVDRVEARKAYLNYKRIRDGDSITTTVKLETAERLLSQLKKEVREFA